MEFLLISFFAVPFAGFVLSLLFKNHQEKIISGIAIGSMGLQMLLTAGLFAYWLAMGTPVISSHILTVYETDAFHFGLDLYYDRLTATYSLVAAILVFIVSIFSRFYMHRESGFKRFYNQFLLFYAGLNLVVIAGNFETFFLGWEVVGITSFLLIAFYRDRYLPVRNALKVLSFYRLGDVALVGAFWFCHHLFHTNIAFENLDTASATLGQGGHHPVQMLLVALLFIQAAAVKSAQMPYSGWLPRAMEGPTVSSAIFYGSLSVHLGVFLLIRTSPVWAPVMAAKVIIIGIGAATAVIGSLIGRVQPTAKTQIAYSSLSQIGLMFIEVALGWHILALVHFAANAFLRTAQLLTSPSAMSYLVHEQFFKYDANKKPAFTFLPQYMRNTLYMLGVKEWNLDSAWHRFVWVPLKKLGKKLHFLRHRAVVAVLVMLMLVGVVHYFIYPLRGILPLQWVSGSYAFLALITILIAWTERRTALRSWIFIAISQVFFMLSVVQQHQFEFLQITLYLSGTAGAFAAGLWCLGRVGSLENGIHLNGFHGHIYEHPKYGLLFLLCSLTMIGFPISPTFLGFDIMFSQIEMSHRLLLVLGCFTFIMLELSVLRIYARVFLGQHVKTYHEVAFRSS